MRGHRPAPRKPAEWFAAAEAVYGDLLETLASYGVEPNPSLRLVAGEGPLPYYEHATMTIGVGLPDPDAGSGRIYWLFAARALGLGSVEEALSATADELPLIVAHEVAHHLRHHYRAPAGNDYVEEQVANEVAVAFLNEHPAYRKTVPRLKEHADRAAEHLRRVSPETAPYLPGFQPDLGEALVAGEGLLRRDLAGLRHLAAALGESLDAVLDEADLVPDAEVEEARSRRREAETYFNAGYAGSLAEYAFFHHEWLRLYLGRGALPALGEALEGHILTDDWERAGRRGTILLLTTTLHHPDADLAVSAAEALAEELGEGAIPALLDAISQERAAPRAATLRSLNRLTTDDDRVLGAARRHLGAPDPETRAAAAALLAEAAGGDGGMGRDFLAGMLAENGPARRAALEEVAGLGNAAFLPALLEALASPEAAERILALKGLLALPSGAVVRARGRVVARLSDADDAVRSVAARLLGLRPELVGGTPAVLSALVRALGDPAAAVRRESAGALRGQGSAAVPALLGAADGAGTRVRVEAALLLLRLGEGGDPARALVSEMAGRARLVEAWRAGLPPDSGPRGLLRDALAEERERLRGMVLLLAGSLGNARAMELALRGISAAEPAATEVAFGVARDAVPPDLLPVVGPLLREEGAEESGAATSFEGLLAYPEPLVRGLAREVLGVGLEEKTEGTMLTTVEKLMFVRAVPLFGSVALSDLRPLCEEFVARRFGEGERVFDFGGAGDALYVITAGRVAVEQDEQGGLLRVAELGFGDHFGEASFFTGEPRSARAVALAETTLLALGRSSFERLGAREPRVLMEVIRTLGRRLRDANADLG